MTKVPPTPLARGQKLDSSLLAIRFTPSRLSETVQLQLEIHQTPREVKRLKKQAMEPNLDALKEQPRQAQAKAAHWKATIA